MAAHTAESERGQTADGHRGRGRRPRPPIPRPMSLPKLAKQPVGLASFESLWDSPLLQAEVELQAASHEERGVMAMRLMSALASQPSPFQSLMSRCIEALRPCVFAQDAAQAAHTPGAAAAEAAGGEGPTHVAM